jgi:hypothetical protein
MSLPRSRRGAGGALEQTGVGHEQQHHVLMTEVLAQPARPLRPLDEHDKGRVRACAQTLEFGRTADRRGEQVGDGPVFGL